MPAARVQQQPQPQPGSIVAGIARAGLPVEPLVGSVAALQAHFERQQRVNRLADGESAIQIAEDALKQAMGLGDQSAIAQRQSDLDLARHLASPRPRLGP